MDDKDEWTAALLQIPIERFNTNGTPAAKPPSAAEKIKATAARVPEWVKLARDRYRETKAAASMLTFASGVADPGPKLQELATAATKRAGEASALIKQGDLARAQKAVEAAEAAASQATQLVADYAVALDHAAVTVRAQVINTSFGSLELPYESSTKIDNFVVPLTKVNESDKTLLQDFQARLSELHKAVSPLLPYLTAPDKAFADIRAYASARAADAAGQSATNTLLKEFMGLYHDLLPSLMAQAQTQLESAKMQLKAIDLSEQAEEKRKEAEAAAKIIDTLIDALVGGIKIVAAGPEGAAEAAIGAAADIVGGLTKTFKPSDLLAEAAALQEAAKTLQVASLTATIASAGSFIGRLDVEIKKLVALAARAASNADRKVIKAAKEFDEDCDKNPRGKSCKFRFRYITDAKDVSKHPVEAADIRYRLWMGADANLGLLVKALNENNYWNAGNAKTVDDARLAIQTKTAECKAKVKLVQGVVDRLDLLFAKGIEALDTSH
jgi:hypothetical protein